MIRIAGINERQMLRGDRRLSQQKGLLSKDRQSESTEQRAREQRCVFHDDSRRAVSSIHRHEENKTRHFLVHSKHKGDRAAWPGESGN
jgi:hypothetical protein